MDFDVWATSSGVGNASATWKVTTRNEISANANKIYPNGGVWFNTQSNLVSPGETITSNGVRYELGNVNKGFDNNRDYVYDYNAWLQPVGDLAYDPSCFRLIRTVGVLTVSRSGGNPNMIIPFEDQLYFSDLPSDNNGIIGNVHYVYLALDGPCSTTMSPYQEVASGADNEKFNGDYGISLPTIGSSEPEVTLDKVSSPFTVTLGSNISYTMTFGNTGRSTGRCSCCGDAARGERYRPHGYGIRLRKRRLFPELQSQYRRHHPLLHERWSDLVNHGTGPSQHGNQYPMATQ